MYGLLGSAMRTHVGLLVPGTRGMSLRQCKVRPEISKILEPAVIHNPGRL